MIVSPPDIDVLVVGGGAAGVAAAIAAKRLGAETLLVDRLPYLGGTATAAEVGTICGLFRCLDGDPQWVDEGFPREFAERLTPGKKIRPCCYRKVLHFVPYEVRNFERTCHLLLEDEGVHTMLHTTVTAVVRDGARIQSVTGLSEGVFRTIAVRNVVDCSGGARIGELCTISPLTDERFQSPSLVFELGNLSIRDEEATRLYLMKELLKIEVKDSESGRAAVSIAPAGVRHNSVLLKLTLIGLPPGAQLEEVLTPRSHRLAEHACRRLSQEVPLLADATLAHVAREIGIRTGPRHVGKEVLDGDAVRSCKQSADSVAFGGWPIEYWGMDGRVRIELLTAGGTYGIPSGSLQSATIENLYFAGKHLSADSDAVASARVIGTCLATGFAAGIMAAKGLKPVSFM